MIEFDCCFRKPMSYWQLLRHAVEQPSPLRQSKAESRGSCRQPRRIMTLSTMTKFLTSKLCQESARLQLPSHLPSLTNQWVKSLQVCVFLGHLCYCYGLASVVVRRPLTSSSQELLGQSWLNLVCSICRVRGQEIVHFMAPPSQGEVISV